MVLSEDFLIFFYRFVVLTDPGGSPWGQQMPPPHFKVLETC